MVHKPFLILAVIGILAAGVIASVFRYETIAIAGTGGVVVTDRLTGKAQYCLGVQGCAPMGQKLPGVLAEEAKAAAEKCAGTSVADDLDEASAKLIPHPATDPVEDALDYLDKAPVGSIPDADTLLARLKLCDQAVKGKAP